jgi:hypothetical protein
MADLSFNERQRLVSDAIRAARDVDLYVDELYDDRAVYSEYGQAGETTATYEVPYAIADDGTVTLGDPVQVERRVTYQAVKFVEGSESMIEGLAIPFGGPFAGKDFHGESFGPDTDIVAELFPNGRPLLYHHGVNKGLGLTVIGRQVEHEITDEGVWARAELDKAAKYHETVAKMVADGKLLFSSGAIPHLVETNKTTGDIKRWPWAELSLTPTPANPNAVVYAVKAADLAEHLTAARIDMPDAVKSIMTTEGGLESEPFSVHAGRMSDLLDGFVDRAFMRHNVRARAKAGRVLSASNRAEVESVMEAIDAAVASLGERRQQLADLLAKSDPKANEAQKAAEVEYLRFLREQARANGVHMDA